MPFDRERGFEMDAVIRDAPDWAFATASCRAGSSRMARDDGVGSAAPQIRDRVAALYAVLGRYERAVGDRSRRSLRDAPERGARAAPTGLVAAAARRRYAEARAAAAALAARPRPTRSRAGSPGRRARSPALAPEQRAPQIAALPSSRATRGRRSGGPWARPARPARSIA